MNSSVDILSQKPIKSHLFDEEAFIKKASDRVSKRQKEQESTMYFQLKQLDGDKQIYLGRSILALMALNKSPAYTEQQNKSFDIDLLASLIIELGISKEEIYDAIQERCE